MFSYIALLAGKALQKMRCQGFDTGLGNIFILNVECREKGFQILEESEWITIQNDTTSTGIWGPGGFAA